MTKVHLSTSSLVCCFMVFAGCTVGRPPPSEPVPSALRPPGDQVLAVATRGQGVQVYECVATKEDAARFAWNLKTPEAELKSASGATIGRHYAGPTWEARDGSKIVGEVVARDPGPDAAAIPWLLLRAKSTSGTGTFGTIGFVQRLHTVGGLAPLAGCDPAHAGDQSRVAYSADYDFYGARN